MLGNIYYIFGIIIILALVKILTKFKSFYRIGEWLIKYKKVTGKKPLKSEFRSKEDYNTLERGMVISISELIWVFFGLFSSSWYIFLSLIVISQSLRLLLKPIKYTLPHFIIAYTLFITKIFIYSYLVINHFFLHQNHLEFLNYF